MPTALQNKPATSFELGDLSFSHYTPRPGDPDWAELARRAEDLVAQALKVQNTAPLTVQEQLREVERKAQALLTSGKSAVKNRVSLARGDETLLPQFFIWTLHNSCNFKCSYCDNHQGEKYFDLPNQGKLNTQQCKQVLDVVRHDTTGVYFCGGEPTMRPDLWELTDYAHEKNYFPLMINTNGSRLHRLLTDPNYKNWLRQMDILIVSLDGLNQASLQKVWGVKHDWCEQVLVNLLALRQLQEHVPFKLVVNTVITPDTVEEARVVMNFARDLGIWFSPVPMNVGPRGDAHLLSDPGYQQLAREILKNKKDGQKILGSYKLVAKLLLAKPLTCYPTLKPHIDIDGSLYWPCKTASQIEPLKVNVLDFPSLGAAYAHAASLMNPTKIHGKGTGQCGAECNWMQNYVSEATARGLMHPLQSGLLDELGQWLFSA